MEDAIVTCTEFNHDGEFLATGDSTGRIKIFRKEKNEGFAARKGDYSVYTVFQSHEGEYDEQHNITIDSQINTLKWLKWPTPSPHLLSANDKTIKLWRISEKNLKVEGFNIKDGFRNAAESLVVPRYVKAPNTVEASLRRVYSNAHTNCIHTASLNSDKETFLSADDLQIHLWNFENTMQSANLVDISPGNMEVITEVITSSEFHPSSCNIFAYSSSKGTIRLCDMRASALCDKHTKLFRQPEDRINLNSMPDMIDGVSDVKFSYSGRYVAARDYLSIKVWDLHMETRPVESYVVHDIPRSLLINIHDVDKFECCWNGTDTAVITGSYNNVLRVFDRNSKEDYTLEVSREPVNNKAILNPLKKGEIGVDNQDFSKKILHTAWNPKDNVIAAATTDDLFIFRSCGN